MMNAADTFVLTSQARGAVIREMERQCGNMEGTDNVETLKIVVLVYCVFLILIVLWSLSLSPY